MATVDVAAVTASLADIFYDDISNQINRAVVLSQVLDVRPGTGKNIQWNAKFGTAAPTTAVIADGADVAVFNNDDKVPAVLQYGTYHDAFAVTGKAMASAAAAANPAELAELFVDEIGDSVERLAAAIAVDVYAGDGSANTLHGLTATAGGVSATGTYAGIDRAVRTQWASNEVDLATGALTFDAMRQLRREIYIASGEKPDLIVCGAEVHEEYGLLFGNERRYVQDVRIRGQQISLDGGYQVLEFDGIPVIEDVNCPDDTMLFLNSRHVHMCQLPDPSTMANRGAGSLMLGGTPEEQLGAGNIKLEARINPLAVTGDAFKWQLILYPQIVVRRPNACGKLINIS